MGSALAGRAVQTDAGGGGRYLWWEDSEHPWGGGGVYIPPPTKEQAPKQARGRGAPPAPPLPGKGNPYMRPSKQDVPRYRKGGPVPKVRGNLPESSDEGDDEDRGREVPSKYQ